MTASLSRRFYNKLAAKYLELRPSEQGIPEYDQWRSMVLGTAFVISSETVHFDMEKFLKASGVDAITARLLARKD